MSCGHVIEPTARRHSCSPELPGGGPGPKGHFNLLSPTRDIQDAFFVLHTDWSQKGSFLLARRIESSNLCLDCKTPGAGPALSPETPQGLPSATMPDKFRLTLTLYRLYLVLARHQVILNFCLSLAPFNGSESSSVSCHQSTIHCPPRFHLCQVHQLLERHPP